MDRKKVSRAVSVLMLAVFIWYFSFHISDFSLLLKISPVYLLLLVMVFLASIIANGIFMKWSLALFNRRIDYMESIRVTLVSTVGNFFAPAGSGLAFRAVYLKKRHKLPYNKYVSIVFCNYVLGFFINSLLGLWALSMLGWPSSSGAVVLAFLLVVLLVASMSAFFIRIKDKPDHADGGFIGLARSSLARMGEGWSLIASNRRVLLGLFALMLINAALAMLEVNFAMNAVGINLPLSGVILLSVIGSLSIFINVTPGNLGIKESIYLLFSATVGLTTAQILSSALVDRAVLFLVLFGLWMVYGRMIHSSSVANTTAKPGE